MLVATVRQVLHLVDAHQPVLSCVRLLQHIQLKVLVTNLRVTHSVISGRLSCTSHTAAN